MKNGSQNILILTLLICTVTIIGMRVMLIRNRVTAVYDTRIADKEMSEKRINSFSILAICDTAPVFIPGSSERNPFVAFADTKFRYYNHITTTWIEPNCTIALADIINPNTMKIPDLIEQPTALGIVVLAITPDLLSDVLFKTENAPLSTVHEKLAEGLTNNNESLVFYYTDADLSFDFTLDERVSTDGFLPEHLQWVVSGEVLSNSWGGEPYGDMSQYSETGGGFMKFANIRGGPFDGQALYAISLLIQN